MATQNGSWWSNSATIKLPIGKICKGSLIAMDIGGSLFKMAYINTLEETLLPGLLSIHLRTCEIHRLDCAIKFVQEIHNDSQICNKPIVMATGVGSFKYKEMIQKTLNVEFLNDCDEAFHASIGLDLLWRYLPKEDLLYEPVSTLEYKCSLQDSGLGVFVLSSVGSALHIAQVNPSSSLVQTIGGDITAGHSFVGLGRLLSDETSFAGLLSIAQNGDRRKVDLFVSDTAGGVYNRIPQSADVSSFGRIALNIGPTEYHTNDVLASLLYNVCDHIGVVTSLVCQNMALRSHKVHTFKYAIFYGSFFTNNAVSRQILKDKILSCSSYLEYDLQPLFVRYEQYLGALGVLHKILDGRKVDCEGL